MAVVSPRYVKSEWGRKEIDEFCKAAEQQGGVRVRDKARIFKVLKTPVPLEQHPPELQSLLGYEFFKVDPETGYNEEETKVIKETRKIFEDELIAIGVTCVRVPVLRAHCEAITFECERPITEDEVRTWVGETLAPFKVPTYVEVQDDKLPRNASGKLLKNVLRGEGAVSFAETM